jgi:hypothetical protein
MSMIAVIQNGTDVSRSSWADVADCFHEAARLICDDIVNVGLQFFADDEVEHLLASLADDVDCIVFATNSLTSDRVQRAVANNRKRLHRYIDNGGGLVLLHQWLDTLSMVLPKQMCPAMATRTSPAPDPAPVQRQNRDDILLHYPMQSSTDRLRDGGFEFGPSWLYFKALDRPTLPDVFKAVLVRDETEVVLARTDDHAAQRVVISTPLLDWQRNVELLANIMRWAAFGSPTRLVRVGDNAASTKLLHWWLCLDGLSAVSQVPAQAGDLSGAERWLLTDPESQVEVFIVPPENLQLMHDRPEVVHFLERGGTMLTTGVTSELPAIKITAYVGDYTKRELARGLYARLRSIPGWDTAESAFELRNIAAAVMLLWSDEFNRTAGAVPPSDLDGLAEEIFRRLATPRHQEDLSSSIALAQTVAVLGAAAESKLELVDAMLARPMAQQFDVRLQIAAVRLGWTHKVDPGYPQAALAALVEAAPNLNRVAPVVRVLDAIALLHELGLLAGDPACILELGEQIADQLERFPPQPGVGWTSSEATADVVRGVLSILDLLGPGGGTVARRLAEHAVAGADIMVQGLARGGRSNMRGVAWRARLTHALVMADDYFPLGLQRLTTLRWPDFAADSAVVSPMQRSLIERLASENNRVRNLYKQAVAASEAKDAQLANERIAAKLGRAAATWLPTLALIAGGIGIGVGVGSNSFWGLVANIGVLVSALVTLLTILFAGLDRVHLLAGSAQVMRDSLKTVAEPVLGSLGKLKPG